MGPQETPQRRRLAPGTNSGTNEEPGRPNLENQRRLLGIDTFPGHLRTTPSPPAPAPYSV